MDNHVHGPKCGCAEYMFNENADDLYGQIDIPLLQCLNERNNQIRNIIQPDSERAKKTHYVESDIDSEIIVLIPFNETVRIRSINIVNFSEENAANRMKAFINVANVDFDLATQQGLEEFILAPNLDGVFANAVKISKFENVNNLVLHINSTVNDPIRISHISVKGVRTNQKKQWATTIYELNPLPHEIDPSKAEFESVF